MIDNPFTLSLLFLLLLGDGDLVAGVCSLLWLFQPVGRRTPWNCVRRFEDIVRVEASDSEDDGDGDAEEDEDTDTDVCGCCYKPENETKKDETADGGENKENPQERDEAEFVKADSVVWRTYWPSN